MRNHKSTRESIIEIDEILNYLKVVNDSISIIEMGANIDDSDLDVLKDVCYSDCYLWKESLQVTKLLTLEYVSITVKMDHHEVPMLTLAITVKGYAAIKAREALNKMVTK